MFLFLQTVTRSEKHNFLWGGISMGIPEGIPMGIAMDIPMGIPMGLVKKKPLRAVFYRFRILAFWDRFFTGFSWVLWYRFFTGFVVLERAPLGGSWGLFGVWVCRRAPRGLKPVFYRFCTGFLPVLLRWPGWASFTILFRLAGCRGEDSPRVGLAT